MVSRAVSPSGSQKRVGALPGGGVGLAIDEGLPSHTATKGNMAL